MSQSFQRIGVVAKKSSREAISTGAELADWLARRGLEPLIEDSVRDPRREQPYPPLQPDDAVDLVVVLGGDGTLLSVARNLPPGVPILGVNLGHLGFLTEIGRAELYPTLVAVLGQRYTFEERSLFDAELIPAEGGEARTYRVLNDAVIAKSALARIVLLTISVDDQLVASCRSDGLIISTPTGSTAYNLSAGGPILAPTLPVAVITPICPHTLTLRPLVVPESSRIEVTLDTPDEEVYLTLDGQEGAPIAFRDRLRMTRSEHRVRLVKVAGRTFFSSLRGKLGWGGAL